MIAIITTQHLQPEHDPAASPVWVWECTFSETPPRDASGQSSTRANSLHLATAAAAYQKADEIIFIDPDLRRPS